MKYRTDLPSQPDSPDWHYDGNGRFPWFIVVIGVIIIAGIILVSPDYLNWVGPQSTVQGDDT